MTFTVTQSPLERFTAKYEVNEANGCWEWTAYRDRGGYGVFSGGTGSYRMVMAHRWSYEHFVGPIPAGLELDHICHTADAHCTAADDCPHRGCVNPAHLELVTEAENSQRSRSFQKRITHCPQGHAYDDANTYVTPGGKRHCRTCKRDANRRRRAAA